MARIVVTPDILRTQSSQIMNLKSQHDATMQQLKNLVSSLGSIWEGQAQVAFDQKFQSMQPTFRQFSDMLQEYADNLRVTANTMEQTDQQIANQIK